MSFFVFLQSENIMQIIKDCTDLLIKIEDEIENIEEYYKNNFN